MKASDINEFELGNHCYGEIIRINDKDIEEIPKEEIIEYINDMLTSDINSNSLMIELLKTTLEYMQFDVVESDSSSCEQCGGYNDYTKYIKS